MTTLRRDGSMNREAVIILCYLKTQRFMSLEEEKHT